MNRNAEQEPSPGRCQPVDREAYGAGAKTQHERPPLAKDLRRSDRPVHRLERRQTKLQTAASVYPNGLRVPAAPIVRIQHEDRRQRRMREVVKKVHAAEPCQPWMRAEQAHRSGPDSLVARKTRRDDPPAAIRAARTGRTWRWSDWNAAATQNGRRGPIAAEHAADRRTEHEADAERGAHAVPNAPGAFLERRDVGDVRIRRRERRRR